MIHTCKHKYTYSLWIRICVVACVTVIVCVPVFCIEQLLHADIQTDTVHAKRHRCKHTRIPHMDA